MPDQRSLIEAVHVALFQEIDHMPEAVFIRNRLARMILENGWKGAQMKVVELVD